MVQYKFYSGQETFHSQNSSNRLNNIIEGESQTTASTFNLYFNDILATLSNNISNNAIIFESYLNGQIPESENFIHTSIVEITKVIHKLKYSNNVGWDNIPANTIKAHVNVLAPTLSNLINKSLAQLRSLP